jgi:hypothetical protein
MRNHLLAAVAVVVGGACAPAADPPPGKLYALLAIDTASNLRDSVEVDGGQMDRLLKANVPAARLDLQTLTGTKLTAAAVAAHFKGLKVRPEDTVLLFYAGHGATDPDKGHAFVPQMGKVPPVFRSDVRDAMKKTGAGLVVLLSDCCSTKSRLAGKPGYGATRPVTPAAGTAIHPTLGDLFFGHRGVVDVTAATDGEASWGDPQGGGLFTRTLARQLVRPPSALDADGDKFVSWKEFFPAVQKGTEGEYKAWSAKMRARGEDVDQPTQRPREFSLGEAGGTGPKAEPAVRTFATVCLVNESGEEVKFKYRFTGQEAWQPAALAPGKRGEYSAPQGKAAYLPRFELQFDGAKSAAELEADAWSGTDTPPPGAAGREFPIILRKKEK